MAEVRGDGPVKPGPDVRPPRVPPGDASAHWGTAGQAGRHRRERLVGVALFLFSAVSTLTTIGIVAVLLLQSGSFFRQVSVLEFLGDRRWSPLFTPRHFGILPLLTGSMLIAACAAAVALPLGMAAAIYLSEYARPRVRAVLKPALEILAGLPTVVYGYFAL